MTFNIELACRRQRKRQKGSEEDGGGAKCEPGRSAGEAIARRSSVCMRCLKMRARMMKCLARKCKRERERERERERSNGSDRERSPSRSSGGSERKECVKVFFCIELLSFCLGRVAVEELFVCLTPVSGTLEKLLHVKTIPDVAHSASVLYGKFITWLNKLLCHKLNEKCIILYLKVRCHIGNLSFMCHTDVYGKFVIDGMTNQNFRQNVQYYVLKLYEPWQTCHTSSKKGRLFVLMLKI